MLKYIVLATGIEAKDTTSGGDFSVSQDLSILYIIVGMIIILSIILPLLIIQDKKNKLKAWKSKKSPIIKRKLSDLIFQNVNYFLKSFPLTRRYVEKLSYRYRLISPCDSKTITRKTVIVCTLSWLLCLLIFVLVYTFNPILINLITVIVAIVLFDSEVVGSTTSGFEIQTNKDIQNLITNLIHYFYVKYRVDDALYRSFDYLSPNMRKAAEQIYQLLLAEEKEDALREYHINVPNKYLRALVNQCVGVMEKGDQTIDGKRLFVRNLENLYREIDIEIEKLEKLRMDFMGIMLCVLAPIFCIDYIKKFAIDIKENMITFFYGKEGFLIDIGLLLLITGIYYVMQKSAEYKTYYQSKHMILFKIDKVPFVKKAMDHYCDKNASKIERLKRELRNNGNNIRPRHFILRSFILSGLVLILSIVLFAYLDVLSKNNLLSTTEAEIELLTTAAKESQYEKMATVIEENTRRFTINEDKNIEIVEGISIEELQERLQNEGTFSTKVINEALAREIIRRVNQYHQEYFSAQDLLLCILLSMFAYYIPFLLLSYNSAVSKEAMEDEVNQFNAIICMYVYVDGMTVKQILIELETFALVFKQSIRTCLNDFGAGDFDALTMLKETEPYEPFRRIVDNLIRCDDMPIYQAFHEVNIEADGYITKRKLANEKSRKKRVFRAYMLAAIPFIALFAYGLVPTLLSSLAEINATIAELENSSF